MEPPRRILMTADAVGGVWTYALELARALEPHGTEITLAVMGPETSADQRREAAGHANVSLHAAPFALEWMEDPWSEVEQAGDWLLGLADDARAELVHLNGYVHAAMPWNLPVLVVAHSCVWSWWTAVHGTDALAACDEYRHRVAYGLAAADLVVAPTAAMLGVLETHYAHFAGRVVPNARDGAEFAPAPEKLPQVFAAGRAWDAAKNIALLDAAAPQVAWPVLVAGDCQAPGGETNIFSHVHCLGRLEAAAMRRHLAESAVYALPARYEPFGLSALEAGLSGCALVLGDIPSLREVWGDAATYVDPDDAAALARTLNALASDERLRTEMSRRARTRALEYSPARMVEGYLAAYDFCKAQQETAA